MRRAVLRVTVSAVLATCAALPPTAGASSFRHCSGTVGGGFYRRISAKQMTCRHARNFVRSYAMVDSDSRHEQLVEGYLCHNRHVGSGWRRIVCKAMREPGKAVRFYAHS